MASRVIEGDDETPRCPECSQPLDPYSYGVPNTGKPAEGED